MGPRYHLPCRVRLMPNLFETCSFRIAVYDVSARHYTVHNLMASRIPVTQPYGVPAPATSERVSIASALTITQPTVSLLSAIRRIYGVSMYTSKIQPTAFLLIVRVHHFPPDWRPGTPAGGPNNFWRFKMRHGFLQEQGGFARV